ncbi:hypothetical protein SAMN02910265_01271 [Ruminococcus flavefaciens]|uniref:Uncharacterized protein n=1 Tax=Ruminococcus flavefaciens TaxID=1265 RepID=A0A1H6J1M2_RUMFL|nr:hypothetical protein [Ruminococcus flavefaciens]SEH52750.1 hypothetical protein SAMN02910265_01271 [Ruminococcus flavefaciens]
MISMKKLFAISSFAVIATVSMVSCTTKYTCTESGHTDSYIKVENDSTTSKGSGSANKVYYDGTGWWDISGKFTYDNGTVKITTGTYRNQTFTDVIDSASSSKLEICGKTYKS